MKKLILTETQAKKLVSKFVNEQVPSVRATEYSLSDGRYHVKVDFGFNYYGKGIKYKNSEIDDIDDVDLDVSYLIEIDHAPHGIKEILITDIRGPKEVKTNISYYPWDINKEELDTLHDRVTEEITIPLDWRKIKIEDGGGDYYKMKYFGVRDKGDIRVVSDGGDGIYVSQIEVVINDFKFQEE